MVKLLNNLEKGGWEISSIHLLYLFIPIQSHRGLEAIPAYTNSGEAGHLSITGLIPGKCMYIGNFNLLVHLTCMSLDCWERERREEQLQGNSWPMIQDRLALTANY